jgi:DNA-directed RNA polymerase specialized sigma24 family protein
LGRSLADEVARRRTFSPPECYVTAADLPSTLHGSEPMLKNGILTGPPRQRWQSPHLEALHQISLGLTKNGKDAITLMHDAMAEASRFWNKTIRPLNWESGLYELISSRYFSHYHYQSQPLVWIHDSLLDPLPVPSRVTEPNRARGFVEPRMVFGGPAGHKLYQRTISRLPAEFRPAMILSYIEGFSNTEIAGLARSQPHEIESLLYRGFRLVKDDIFTHLIDTSGFRKIIENGELVR